VLGDFMRLRAQLNAHSETREADCGRVGAAERWNDTRPPPLDDDDDDD